MEKRYITFVVLCLVVIGVNALVMHYMQPAPKPQPVAQKADAGKAGPKVDANKADKHAQEKVEPAANAEAEPGAKAAPQPAAGKLAANNGKVRPNWATLGSVDPATGYRMLVTFTSAGAAVERVEMSSPQYRDLESLDPKGGYLGHLAPADAPGNAGALVQVVGAGTPAAEAGIKAG